ncbi:hypothetical protein [Planococcus lenghuensis]|uniref:Peptidyl-prolyl cis-trans isomerase n=1 Tax=Planococcus lenghuensis TaxID=2213202 RepID=A0A1Q2L0D9_9BACL|nr:hypothetical protein [Planococcus lenghuensis]AQQ53834.1 hypothetical protein B0X71_12540 [Planococcus lenghuensis]
MEMIIPVKGAVAFQITLDPGTWIFDDRKIELTDFFSGNTEETDELEEYKRATGAHWSREIMEGAVFPPTLKTERKFKKSELLTGTFGMRLEPFLNNAQPLEGANQVVIETKDGETAFDIETAKSLLLKFSHEGKPLQEDGPAHVLLPDGSNSDHPITDVRAIRVEKVTAV